MLHTGMLFTVDSLHSTSRRVRCVLIHAFCWTLQKYVNITLWLLWQVIQFRHTFNTNYANTHRWSV